MFRRLSPQRGNRLSAMLDTGTPTTGRPTTPPVQEQPICTRSFMATATSSPAAASQLDVIFDGAWILVPSADASGKIIEVNIYSPACGHPLGVFFTNQVNPNPWPAQSAFYQLDSHSYTINLQRGSRAAAGMPISGINTTINHCVSQGRPIASNWDMLASI